MDDKILQDEYWYPFSERFPAAESPWHLDETIYLFQALREHFRSDPTVYVNGDLFLFHTVGGMVANLEPDIFVVKDAPEGGSGLLSLAYLGQVPCMVLEVTSEATIEGDLSIKKNIYERLGIPEFFLHDVLGDVLQPRLQGYRLVDGRYRPIPLERDGSLVSQTTGVTFTVEDQRLRLIQTATGEPILSDEEVRAAKRAAEEQARAAEEELARLRAEIAQG